MNPLITKELVAAKDFEAIQRKVEECIWWVKKARGQPLFLGVEHVGLYPTRTTTTAEIVDWYANLFNFKKNEGASPIFLSGSGTGRIEVMKEAMQIPCHLAIRVSNSEEACKYIEERGIQLEEPKIKKCVKAVFLKQPDKAGNRVHLFYTV